MANEAMESVDKAIDSAYLLGQIDAFSSFLDRDYDPKMTILQNLLVPGAFEALREQLAWRMMSWCLANNLAMAAGR